VHIAFVTPESPYGDDPGCGIAAYLRAIIPAIAKAGHRVTVIANAKAELSFQAENECASVRHFRLPSLHWYAAKIPALHSLAPLPLRQLEWSRAFQAQVARVAATTKIDVIESTEIGALFLHRIAPLVIRLHGSERVFREHSGLPVTQSVRWNDVLEARACNRAAAITAPSKFHAQEIAKRRGWPLERVRVIPNPISESILNAAGSFHRNGHNERIVLYTGRLAPVKGIETLFAAAKLVRAQDPSVSFVLAGPWQMPQPPEAYGLQSNTPSLDRVRWIGVQSERELVEWYKRASLLVIPSKYESFGISAIEAMAFQLPVVATDAGALPETVRNNDEAIIVPKGDSRALADAMIRVCSLPANKHARPNSQLALVCDAFAPARAAKATLELYDSLRPRSK
jgi:glycosyltransferase involved in cell wall biosynthesis